MLNDQPVGHIGAQDKGEFIELRRMYVRAEYRRRGIGTRLARALIEHCREKKVGVIELWTAEQGPERFLYEQHGFCQVEVSGEELIGATGGKNEIRMRLTI